MLYYQKDRLFFWIGSSSVIDIRVVAVTRFLSYIGNQHFKLLVLMGKVYEKLTIQISFFNLFGIIGILRLCLPYIDNFNTRIFEHFCHLLNRYFTSSADDHFYTTFF